MNPIDDYAHAVVAGRVLAGTYHRRACERHLRDRARAETAAFPYRFELARAERFYRFAEQLRHYKGEWAGRRIELQPHQRFRLGSLFAWLHVSTGLRRFRTVYTEVPRKNGKALALETRVPTPQGFRTMGDLSVGDDVFGPDGRPTRVRWTSEVLTDRPCYRVTFSDGWSCVADADHLWAVRAMNGHAPVVVTTATIAARGAGWCYVPSAAPPHADAAIDLEVRTLGQDAAGVGARVIVGCEPCASVPVRCLRVERPDGLFLIGDRFVTTHNSLEAAIVALYLTFFDGEPGSEGYCIATKREQARIVFDDCKRLVLASRELRERIRVLTANLNRFETASKLEPLGADRDSTDGLNPSIVTIDEAHALKSRGLIDVMETATGARRQPVINWITTAGSSPVSPCGDQHDYACKVLDQVLTDETLFAFIAHADVEDDPFVEATWRKANPNYGVTVKPADLEALAYKARHMPEAANAFRQKRLNIWVSTSAPWLSLEGWRAGQTTWTADDMRGEDCWLGIDMSSKIDLTAIVAVFPPTETRATWRLLAQCLTPEETLDERAHRDRAPYRQWVDRGYLQTNEGKRIDQDVVRAIVLDLARRFSVQQIGIDPWNTGNLVGLLLEDGFDVIEIPQNLAQMSTPAKEFEADVLDGLVDAGGNALMTWAVANVVVQRDNKDNIYPVKKKSRGRIDPVIAALMGRKLAALDTDEPEAADPELVVA